MADKRQRRQNRKAPQQDGPLAKTFSRQRKAASPKKKDKIVAKCDEMPRKQMTSNFLSYLSCAMKAKTPETASHATMLHKKYFELDWVQKKQLVTDFFRHGGRRSGLESAYTQVLKLTSEAASSSWTGYCTFGMLREMFKVWDPNLRVGVFLGADGANCSV